MTCWSSQPSVPQGVVDHLRGFKKRRKGNRSDLGCDIVPETQADDVTHVRIDDDNIRVPAPSALVEENFDSRRDANANMDLPVRGGDFVPRSDLYYPMCSISTCCDIDSW